MSQQFVVLLAIGTIFGLMAFLIFYIEYERHNLDSRRFWKEVVGAALVTFLVFFILSLIDGYWAASLVKD